MDEETFEKRVLSLGETWLRDANGDISHPGNTEAELPLESLSHALEGLLAPVGKNLHEVVSVGVWISGLTPAILERAASAHFRSASINFAESVARDALYPSIGGDPLCSLTGRQRKLIIKSGGEHPCYLVDLRSRGEYLGAAAIVLQESTVVDDCESRELRATIGLLCKLVGEAVFTYRLRLLASPVKIDGDLPPREDYCAHATELIARGMGVDGAVLRLKEGSTKELRIFGSYGKLYEDADSEEEERAKTCERIAKSAKGFALFSVVNCESSGSNIQAGIESVELSKHEQNLLKRIGVGGWLLLRLESNRTSFQKKECIGTLAIYSRVARQFSHRDIAMFRSFCQRTADELALIRTNEDLAFSRLAMETQYDLTTRAELVALLAHDLYHRVNSVRSSVDRLKRATLKGLRENRKPEYIASFTDEVDVAANELTAKVASIRAAHSGLDERAEPFDVADTAQEVSDTLQPVLKAHSMKMEVFRDGNLEVMGVRSVLRMVYYNLAINSIDAQRGLKSERKNNIKVRCRERKMGGARTIVILFSDDGPGIDRQKFSNPADIFELGKTSKPKGKGTGTGLPVSRSLLETYFEGGDLRLLTGNPPVFEITIQSKEKR